MNVNKVIIVGRLTRDPEVRTTNSGSTVANVGVATNRFWKDQGGQKQEQTEFHNIVLFGKTAELAGQYLVRGQEAYFEGRLQTSSYTGKDNVERKTTEIVAETMQFGSKPQGGGYAGGGNSQAPAQNNQPVGAPAPASAPIPNQNTSVPAPQPVADENIPTINLDDEPGEVRIEDVPF
ncbi:single-stranded DNA-binding protein [Patescibacteria group bacterium]